MHKLVVCVLSVVAVLSVSSCAKAALGETCSDTSDCDAKLQCIPYGSYTLEGQSQPTCVDTNRICSITCNSDSECTSALGNGHICVHDCSLGSCVEGSRG